MSQSNPPVKPRVSGAVAVVGAGIAGMQSALDLADAGYLVHLVEKDISIGGVMAQLDKTFPTNDCSTCMISPKLIEVASHPNIEIISRAQVTGLEGQPGRFTLRVRRQPRFIDEAKCSGCGECVKVCPVTVPGRFNEGLGPQKAVFRHFPQAVPSALAIEKVGVSPCRDACPAGVSAQGYVALIAQGKYAEALALIRENNPLPAVCGRVCTHPCETACSRGQADDPVAIRELKRFVTDWEVAQGTPPQPPAPRAQYDQKVAVIGSGPAGLACAYYLALEGYQPVVLEALGVAGGMLRVGIPDYRLPPEVLEYEIEHIRRAGVEIRLNEPLGGERTLESLRDEGYAAVFLGVGAHKPLNLAVPGENLPGVRRGVDFLRAAALGQAACPGRRVVVIGGGNVALDAARTALRLGSREVTVVYRRTRDEMPAYAQEVAEALEEGIQFRFLTAPLEFQAQGGQLAGLATQPMALGEPDASGRRRPLPVVGATEFVPCDGAITAIGQAPDLDFLEPRSDLGVSPKSLVVADAITLATNLPGVFAGGDAVSGPATVIEAIAAGRRGAESIHRYLQGRDLREGREAPRPVARVDTSGLERVARHLPPLADSAQRAADFREVEGCLDEAAAQAEAARCLACGVCSECYQCVTVCQAGAIDHDARPQDLSLAVGAVIAAPGFRPTDPRLKGEYGYGRWPNVITSLEFERILSASGPYAGHLKRPGDGQEPRNIAWIQCVGSRDAGIGREYCSYICCMQAAKQAIIAGEHAPGLETAIFYMDVRAQGKGFDRYYQRAKERHGVRYVRSMPSRVLPDQKTGDLLLRYFDADGQEREERFDLVVLSVGLAPHPLAAQLAQTLGVGTDQYGFARRAGLDPVRTTREGIFACGVFQAPKDIPETVMQASGAAAAAGELLAPGRGSQARVMEYPPEREITTDQEARVGVFVCHCGINIGSVVDVPAVVDYVRGLPGVVHAEEFLFTCSTDSQERISALIREQGLNRVVVASCSPRTHEELFRATLRQAGLNPYLFEMANIRDQCSWVHQGDHRAATAKAQDLVRMSVARAVLLHPVRRGKAPVTQRALVIGGGPAGLTAALSLSRQGFPVELVEAGHELGGLARRLAATLEGHQVGPWLQQLISLVEHDAAITIHTGSRVVSCQGHQGAMVSVLKEGDQTREVRHGAVILATGAREHQPRSYLYGQDPRVVTHLELHEKLHADAASLAGVKRVAMIQCVGSREPEHEYCSRVCCSQAVGNALRIKELSPDTEVYVLYRDIRTYALKELAYQKARSLGVRFLRYEPEEPPMLRQDPQGAGLQLLVKDQNFNQLVALEPDLVSLAAAVRPQADAHRVASQLKLPLDQDGFFMEAHLKLRPVDFAASGFFLAGAAHGPKPLEEVVAQARAAASRAAAVLAQQEMTTGGEVAVIDAERCVACLTCVRTCPYGVPRLTAEGVVRIDPAACHGCGACAAACPRKLITVQHHTDDQIVAKTLALKEATHAGVL